MSAANQTALDLQVVVYEDGSSTPQEVELVAGKRRNLELGELACDKERELRFSVFEAAGGSHLAQGTILLRTGESSGGSCASSRVAFEQCKSDAGVGVEVTCRGGAADRGRLTVEEP